MPNVYVEYPRGGEALKSTACYVFALYGGSNDHIVRDIMQKYGLIGDYVFGLDVDISIFSREIQEQLGVIKTMRSSPRKSAAIMDLIKTAFGFASGNEAELCGLLREGQCAPEHMWITYDGHYYDKYPDNRVRKKVLSPRSLGLHPPSESVALSAGEVFQIPIARLTPQQMTVINGDWPAFPGVKKARLAGPDDDAAPGPSGGPSSRTRSQLASI